VSVNSLQPDVAASAATSPASWTIEPWSSRPGARARELWQYRRLALFFGLKALQKIYKRTKLGWLWLFIRPLFPLVVQAVIFGRMLGVSSDGVPYFLFLVTASAIWQLFASALTWGTRSLELNRGLLNQLYLPRLILLPSMMSPALLTFVIYIGVLVCALVGYRIADGHWYMTLSVRTLWALLAVFMAILLALAISLWTSVAALVARDVRLTLNYVLSFWVFLTPVVYPLSAVPAEWRFWILLNPMAPIVEAFKFGVLGIGGIQAWQIGLASSLILLIMIGGVAFFVRAEAEAVDQL
jgi:lipopolysaccharide transport system permease protein